MLKFNICLACRKFPSYFHELPDEINQHSDGVDFEKACACSEDKDKEKTNECHEDGIPVFFPGGPSNERFNRILMCNRNVKRDITNSDDLTEQDFELFKKRDHPEVHKRPKRSILQVSKENATRYCTEKLADTTLGKLCAKLGTNIQALVNVCSADIEVSFTHFKYSHNLWLDSPGKKKSNLTSDCSGVLKKPFLVTVTDIF